MKHFIFFLFFTTTFFAQNYYPLDRTPIPSTSGYTATTYYVSSTGNDVNSGTSENSAWQSLTKVNSFTPRPGDRILFQRGDTFYGQLVVNDSGVSGNPVTFGSYGSGAKPIITGFTDVTDWTDSGGNIWESTNAVSALSTCNMVVINGVNTPMGRYPNAEAANSGYLTFQFHSGTTSITSSSLTGTPDWAGAELVIRNGQFVLDRTFITEQTGGTLTYSPAISFEPPNGYGFFVQNDIRTLDTQNEWYYNPSTKKISIYSTSEPTGVKVSTVEYLVQGFGGYVTFDNISFTGANSFAFFNDWGIWPSVVIQNSLINFSGISGIRMSGMTDGFKIENDSILNSNNNGIDLWVGNPSAIIRNNTIQNSGIYAGMGQNGMQQYSGIAPGYLDTNTGSIIEGNKVLNSGYIGINFNGTNVTVKNNLVNTFCLVLGD